jgi:hypothetical protein
MESSSVALRYCQENVEILSFFAGRLKLLSAI